MDVTIQRGPLLALEEAGQGVRRAGMERLNFNLERTRRVRIGVTSIPLGETVREAQQFIELGDREWELGKLKLDGLCVGDELDEVVGDRPFLVAIRDDTTVAGLFLG